MSAKIAPGSTIAPKAVPDVQEALSIVPEPNKAVACKVDKLKAYRLRVHNKLTYQEIADQLGVSKQSVQQALVRFSEIIGEPDDIQAGEDIRLTLFQAGRQTLLRSLVDPKTILKAPLKDRAIAFEKLDRAARLEAGQSTDNLGVLGKLVVEAASEVFTAKPGKTALKNKENPESVD